jgi:hypothetical protein
MNDTSDSASHRLDRWFFTFMGALVILVVFAGFGRTFYWRPASVGPLSTLLVVHGAVFTAWVLLFIVQTSLVASRRVKIHMQLGWVGAVLASLMVVLGFSAAVAALRLGRTPIPGLDPRSFLVVPMFDIGNFCLLIAAGLILRKKPDAHRRLMFLATIALIDAAIARIPLKFIAGGGPPVFFGLTDLFILAGWAWDWSLRRRIHPAFAWGGGILILSQPLRLAISGTAPWLRFADLFLR